MLPHPFSGCTRHVWVLRTCSKKLEKGLFLVHPGQTHSSHSKVQKRSAIQLRICTKPAFDPHHQYKQAKIRCTCKHRLICFRTLCSDCTIFQHWWNVMGWLKLRAEDLCIMVVLGSHFLHLNHYPAHRRWAPIPHSALLFFCASSRQLVSNIYLLPFQLDKDNMED